ncbi:hypothetical protein ACHAXS_012060 [Conticribra weissflogii]
MTIVEMAKKTPFKLQPPGYTCKPVLVIGLPTYKDWGENLSNILIHCLLYSTTSTYMIPSDDDYEGKLQHLTSLDGEELMKLSREHNATVIWSEDELLNEEDEEVDMVRLRELEKGEYQAIIVDDTAFIREPDITEFVANKYEKGASVVVVAIEGIFNISPLRRKFNVDWEFGAYTKRDIKLNDLGKQIIGDAFPEEYVYTKSQFIIGEGELFTEFQHPEDYEDEEDYPDGPPSPAPGSPVVTVFTSGYGCLSWDSNEPMNDSVVALSKLPSTANRIAPIKAALSTVANAEDDLSQCPWLKN